MLNGGGRIKCEYGLGLRLDRLLARQHSQGMQRIVIECRIRRGSLEGVLAKGLPQTAEFMDRCGAAAGHLVIIGRNAKPCAEKVFRRSGQWRSADRSLGHVAHQAEAAPELPGQIKNSRPQSESILPTTLGATVHL